MSDEKSKTEGMNEKQREEIRGRLLPILTPLLCVGVATMANPHVGFVVTATAVILIWFFITWVGPLSGKRIRYSGYGAIGVLVVVIGLCLRYGAPKNGDVIATAPQPQVTASSPNSPGSHPLAVGQLNVEGDLNINPPTKPSPESELSGILMPANEPDPFPLPPDFPRVALKVFLGSNFLYHTKMGSYGIIRVGGEDLVALKCSPSGLYLSAHIRRKDARIEEHDPADSLRHLLQLGL